jgi:hypothetical protein
LGRIEETNTYPFGMKISEFTSTTGTNISSQAIKKNVTNNNNIVTRNSKLTRLGGLKKKSEKNPVLIGRRNTPGKIRIGIVITPERPFYPRFNIIGIGRIYLPTEIMEAWINEGSQGYGIGYDGEDQSITILESNAQIKLPEMDQDVYHFMNVAFELYDNNSNPITSEYSVTMRQFNEEEGEEEEGAFNFMVNVIDSTNGLGGKIDTEIKTKKAENTKLTLYPNPAFSTINILYENASQINEVSIYNELGILVKQLKFEEQAIKTIAKTIDMADLKEGFYFIITSTNNKSFINKFIKQ